MGGQFHPTELQKHEQSLQTHRNLRTLPLYSTLLLDSYSTDPIQFNCSQIGPTLPCDGFRLQDAIPI